MGEESELGIAKIRVEATLDELDADLKKARGKANTPLRLPADSRVLDDGCIEATYSAGGLHRAVIGAGLATEPA